MKNFGTCAVGVVVLTVGPGHVGHLGCHPRVELCPAPVLFNLPDGPHREKPPSTPPRVQEVVTSVGSSTLNFGMWSFPPRR
jgi:hypothetical protein